MRSGIESMDRERRRANISSPLPNPLLGGEGARCVAHRIATYVASAALGVLVIVALQACGDDDSAGTPPPSSAQSGFVDEQAFSERGLRYLRYATQRFDPGDVLNVLAHMERARVDPSYTVPG